MNRRKIRIGDMTFDVINTIILILFMLICIYPFYYVFIFSISNPDKTARGIYLLPAGFKLDSYSQIFNLNGIFSAFIVSLARTLIGTTITLVLSSLFAYAVSKNELPYRKIIYRICAMAMYLNAGLIPWYITMKNLGLKNNFLLYILPYAVNAYYIILLKTFFEQLPASLEESAMIDGAGYFTVFWKIILPLSKPILATIVVFASVGQWNTWHDNFFLVASKNLQTLQLILYNYLNQAQSIAASANVGNVNVSALKNLSPESIRMTITVVVTLPILLVYPFMQKYFVKGIMMGAVKG
ncbi:carbohydrate ABC transporter permease [Clostridium swellfunianum]|uniref:carbohydrate ABC transporter permease n=1 Tax=Clostridium swellfunianum TaxID=1367462 RepID=UPI00202F3155|nr:carbohydrate ABC transporter permease [Clostridium swellfunianum]MCM0647606.1 carbohydrate ABC transporter permease [Clostridium swellfunianum]